MLVSKVVKAGVRGVVRQLVVLVGALVLCSTASAGFLPEDPDAFLKRMRHVIKSQDSAVMLGLYNWERVTKDTRRQVEDEVSGLMALEIKSIDLMELPPTVSSEMVSNGKRYEMNLEPERMVVIQYVGENGPTTAGLPIGRTPEGYAIGITIEVGDAILEEPGTQVASAPAAPQSDTDTSTDTAESAPAPEAAPAGLLVEVTADADVVTEIACAYFDSTSGERLVETWKGEGSFRQQVNGSSFETCAAKKRSGNGATHVTLAEGDRTVYSETGQSAEEPLVYMRQ